MGKVKAKIRIVTDKSKGRKTKKTRIKKRIKKIKTENFDIKEEYGENFEKCSSWLNSVKKVRKKYVIDTTIEDYEENVPEPEDPEITQKLDMPLRKLVAKFDKEDLKHTFLFECEYTGCSFECVQEIEYFKHIAEHLQNYDPETNCRNGLFHCEWDLCEYQTANLDALKTHTYYHAYHTKLKTYGAGLAKHISYAKCGNDSARRNRIPETLPDQLCHWVDCNERYFSMQALLEHLEFHILQLFPPELKGKRQQIQKCLWNNCNKTFKRQILLKQHLHAHIKAKVIACHNCGSVFAHKLKFLEHFKRQIPVELREFQCSQCLKYFTTESILRDHMRGHINCMKCTLCDMSCTSKSALVKHIRYRHCTERLYKCSTCGKTCVTVHDLRAHSLMHMPSLYKCLEYDCNYSCRTVQTLKMHHMRKHDSVMSLFQCHCCDSTYRRGHNLSNHLIKKHNYQLPAGHSRFSYRQSADGFYRLQTVRVESSDITHQIIDDSTQRDIKIEPCTQYIVDNIEEKDNRIFIVVHKNENSSSEHFTEEDEMTAVLAAPELPELTLLNHENTVIKSIDDFLVMKKYIKNPKKKNIEITYDETDATGNIWNSKTIKIDELFME